MPPIPDAFGFSVKPSPNSNMLALPYGAAAVLLAFVLMLVLKTLVSIFRSWHFLRRYFPGPVGSPFIGNLRQLPKDNVARTFSQWRHLYGPIIYLRVFTRKFVILNTREAVFSLFEKKKSVYCHRPHLVMAHNLVGRNTMLFMNYGEDLKKARKMLLPMMNAKSLTRYWALQELESWKFIVNLNASPENLALHARTTGASFIIKLFYGLDISGPQDKLVALAERHSRITTVASESGRWLVDSFPILRYMPEWFPGASFKKWARQAGAQCQEFITTPYNSVKKAIAEGTAIPSFVSENLFTPSGEIISSDDEKILSLTAASMYSGGTDTFVSAICTFFLLMLRHPEIQQKAQAEVDRVTEGRWLPGAKDCASFPYIEALVKEVFRFNPPVPLVPHSLAEDDIYEGYVVPKGAYVVANIWGLLHDEAVYSEPDIFRPERHEKRAGYDPVPDPLEVAFGFGRRVCPGRALAVTTMFLNVVHVLFAFDITPHCDEMGRPVLPPVEFMNGHVSHTYPFKCKLQPRDIERITLFHEAIRSQQTSV